MADEWVQGEYIPENKSKCVLVNGKNPVFRSSWERRMMCWLDNNVSVSQWASEPIAIEYRDMSDPGGPVRRYYPDLMFTVRDVNGATVKYMAEIKPKSQCPQYSPDGRLALPPKPKKQSRKSMANWQAKAKTILTNHCKWQAAKAWCKRNGYVFKVVTEENVF